MHKEVEMQREVGGCLDGFCACRKGTVRRKGGLCGCC